MKLKRCLRENHGDAHAGTGLIEFGRCVCVCVCVTAMSIPVLNALSSGTSAHDTGGEIPRKEPYSLASRKYPIHLIDFCRVSLSHASD